MPADFLDQKKDEIGARIRELKPLVAEYERLEAAARALDGIPAAARQQPAPAMRAAARPVPSSPSPGTPPRARRGRPKGSGRRGAQALEMITAHPGITIPELAQEMGIKQNYLYRLLPTLAQDRRVRKDDRGWHPVQSA